MLIFRLLDLCKAMEINPTLILNNKLITFLLGFSFKEIKTWLKEIKTCINKICTTLVYIALQPKL